MAHVVILGSTALVSAFTVAAQKMGLPVKASADGDLATAKRVAVVGDALVDVAPAKLDRFPANVDVADAANRLLAKLLGGGGEAPPERPAKPAPKPVARVGRETKGRGGKGVTLISDVPLSAEKLAELATKLKAKIGTGGTVKDGVIEIQGDQRERVCQELERLGYAVKRVGG